MLIIPEKLFKKMSHFINLKWLKIYTLTFAFSTCQELTITENGFVQEQPKVQKAITVKLDGINRASFYKPVVDFKFFINKPQGLINIRIIPFIKRQRMIHFQLICPQVNILPD